jgi:lysyl-tRNA synthetase class 2
MCKVYRADERSALHNHEFTMLEWYSVGFDMAALIGEVTALVQALLRVGGAPARAAQRLTYREAFLEQVGVDPLEADRQALEAAAAPAALPDATLRSLSRDELLDLLMAVCIGPQLGRGALTFITHYPASQAALARLDPADPRVAHRFELYADGVELANGFHELADSTEQRRRFEADQRERQRRGIAAPALDERLLAALAQGLPDCAGVALGFDRVAMLAAGAARIDEVLSFTYDQA